LQPSASHEWSMERFSMKAGTRKCLGNGKLS
jgi:hypothetical protein